MTVPRVVISDNVARLWAELNIKRRQVPFVTAVALTRTAQVLAQNTLPNRTPEVFDRPTPLTRRGFGWTAAKKERLVSTVFLKDAVGKGTPPERYLRPQIFGGQRNLKRFERALELRGLMPKGLQAVPGPGAEIDDYGNMRSGQIVAMLSALRAFGEQGYVANRAAKSRGRRRQERYFVPPPGRGLAPGVYREVSPRVVVPVVLFLKPALYRVRWEWEADIRRAVPGIFDAQFRVAWAEAEDRGIRP